jgi:hypothetical protein
MSIRAAFFLSAAIFATLAASAARSQRVGNR